MKSFVYTILQLAHLQRRGAFARDESAEDHAAVSRRQKRFGNENEEPDRACQTNNPDHRRDPTMLQKPPERAAVQRQYALFDATNNALHPGLFRAFASGL